MSGGGCWGFGVGFSTGSVIVSGSGSSFGPKTIQSMTVATAIPAPVISIQNSTENNSIYEHPEKTGYLGKSVSIVCLEPRREKTTPAKTMPVPARAAIIHQFPSTGGGGGGGGGGGFEVAEMDKVKLSAIYGFTVISIVVPFAGISNHASRPLPEPGATTPEPL